MFSSIYRTERPPMKKAFKVIMTIMSLMLFPYMTACATEHVDSLTYAVYPYLPDPGYYQEIIERR